MCLAQNNRLYYRNPNSKWPSARQDDTTNRGSQCWLGSNFRSEVSDWLFILCLKNSLFTRERWTKLRCLLFISFDPHLSTVVLMWSKVYFKTGSSVSTVAITLASQTSAPVRLYSNVCRTLLTYRYSRVRLTILRNQVSYVLVTTIITSLFYLHKLDLLPNSMEPVWGSNCDPWSVTQIESKPVNYETQAGYTLTESNPVPSNRDGLINCWLSNRTTWDRVEPALLKLLTC